MLVILDYGMGNLGSVSNMLNKLNCSHVISQDKKDVLSATKLILPGVGSFDEAVKNLKHLDLWDIIIEKVHLEEIPILGICLGMQLLANESEEGVLKGFGFIKARISKFNSNDGLKVPHMGWNRIKKLQSYHPLLHGIQTESRFYFVHSYYFECEIEDDVAATTGYGFDFASVVSKKNIHGVQFHPEKSHRFGMHILSNFVKLC